jgi:hypothetical protein
LASKDIAVIEIRDAKVKTDTGEYAVESLVSQDLKVDFLLGTQFFYCLLHLITSLRRCRVLMDNGDEVPFVEGGHERSGRVVIAEGISILL